MRGTVDPQIQLSMVCTDLIAELGAQKVLVQCKHWLRWKVHEDAVKILFADVTAQGFSEGWLVTCGRFTGYAAAWAKGKPIRLIDGEELVKLVGSVASPSKSDASRATSDQQTEASSCPSCGSRLRRLTNRYDETEFWAAATVLAVGRLTILHVVQQSHIAGAVISWQSRQRSLARRTGGARTSTVRESG